MPRDVLAVADPLGAGPVDVSGPPPLRDLAPLVSQPLVGLDVLDCRPQPVPGLASSWAWSADRRDLTVTLRPDAAWPDGAPVAALDVVTAWDRAYASQDVGWRDRLDRLDPAHRPRVVDASHVAFRFLEDVDPDVAAVSIGAPAVRDGADPRTSGDGPYVVRATSADQTVLARNGKYAGPSAGIGKIDVRRMPLDAAIPALASGDVQMVRRLLPEDVATVRGRRPDVRLERRPDARLEAVFWNGDDPSLADVRVRQALAMSVDVEALATTFLTASGETWGRVATGTVSPVFCRADAGLLPAPVDPERVDRLIAASGGKRPSPVLLVDAGDARLVAVAKALADAWTAAGFPVSVEAKPAEIVAARVAAGNYQGVLVRREADPWLDPADPWLGSPPRGNDDALARAVEALRQKPSDATWKGFQEAAADAAPMLPLWWVDEIVAIDPRISAQIDFVSAYHHLDRWTIDVTRGKSSAKDGRTP